jgi:hypothetical protein
VRIRPDDDLQIKVVARLLKRVEKRISKAINDVRYAMNNFVICVGTDVTPLADQAITTARVGGKVEVDMGQTACKVPAAEPYILKSREVPPPPPNTKPSSAKSRSRILDL